MALVRAYDTRTGRKLEHPVPEEWIDHPRIGRYLSKTPRQKAAERKKNTRSTRSRFTTPYPLITEAPAAGDTEKE